MALRKQALSYGDDASQYGFESFKQYKKQNRGGGRGLAKGAISGLTTGASLGATIGATGGSFALPGLGTVAGGVGGAIVGGLGGLLTGGTAGAIGGNRQMKREYLRYAKQQTEEGLRKAYESSPEKIEADRQAAIMAEQRAAELERQKALYAISSTQPMVAGEMPMYKKGGVAKMVMINVEKGELAVDPRTMKVIMDFNDVPKHPKGKDVINQKGNVKVPVGTIIIPADMRRDFLKAEPGQRIEMAAELIERQREGEEKEMEENEGMEEQAMPQGIGMAQEQMPQGQGMMAMMGEEGGEEMEQAKMGMGGYIKKYQEAGIVDDGYYDITPTKRDLRRLKRQGITDEEGIARAMQERAIGNMFKEAEKKALSEAKVKDSVKDAGKAAAGTTPEGDVTGTETERTTGGSGLDGYALAQGIGLLGAAIPQYFAGKKQEKEARKALEALQGQPMARYTPTAELQRSKQDVEAARERAKYGFSAAERAAREQQISQMQRQAYQRARETGLSGTGQAMLAALGSQRLQAANEMAIQDQRLQLEKQKYAEMGARSIADAYQRLQDAQTSQDIRYRTMQEQAYGGALRAGLENQYGAFSTAGAGLGYAAGSGLSSLLGLL